MSRTATINYLSQIVPLNKGVPIPASWPLTSGTYDDSSTLKSAFTNVSTNARIITIDNGAFDTAGVKSINCYEIHNAPTATVNSNSVFEISNIQAGPSVNSILNRLYPYDTDLESYLTVSASTRSNRISLEGQGALSSMISSDSFDTDYDYFVLIHADDAKKHHLAKITELHTYEVFGDGFDFSPAFDGDIPKDTKISIYKGPASTDTHIVAVGYGLLGDGDDSDGRHDTYVEVSRPTFYFYEDRCEKDRLSANTKYRVIKNIAYEVSTTLHLDFGKKMSGSVSDTGSTPDFQKHGTSVCFLTASDFGGYIIDKTAYTQYGELVDNLKDKDKVINTGATTTTTIVSNGAASTWSTNSYTSSVNVSFGEWDKCFFNTMRDKHTANGASSTTYDSPIKRIITYENSDLKNYHLPHIQYIDLFDSVASVGNYMEMKFPDANKILNLKLKNFDNVLVKKEINSEDYSGAMNVQLPGVVTSSTTGWSLTFSKLTVEQDIRDIWGSSLVATENTNKLRVGDFVFAGDFLLDPAIGTDGYEQIFTITHYRNVRTDNTWTTVSSNWDLDAITNGDAFVYPFMNKEGVIVAGFDIDTEYDGSNIKRNGNTITGIDNFISNTEIFVRDKELTGFTFDLNYGDKNLNYVKPKITTYDGYQIRTRINGTTVDTDTVANVPELYSYINGDILHMDKVFDGYIEAIKSNIQGGIVSYNITGRDYTNRMLDSVVNRNYTHSNDYIFTTLSPEADMITQSGTVHIQDFDIGTSTIVLSSNNTSMQALDFEVGDVLYCTLKSQTKLIGVVSAISGGKIDGSGGFSLGTYWNGSTHAAFTAGSHAKEITLTEPTIYSSYNKTYGATDLKYSRKATSLGKALSANTSDTIFPTTITGCSNKGIVYKSGEKINISTGAYSSDLIESSANESKFSTGYPISKIEGQKNNTNFADYRFSISSDVAETTIVQNDTISSTTEFAIANTQNLRNKESVITLAPIFPVVLAKSSSNTSDTRISNGNGLYFVNTQGLSDGGFLHLLDSETNSQGASITFANPGYKDFSSSVDSVDYRLEDNFGAFIWRYSGLQTGSLFWSAEYLDKVWDIKKESIYYTSTGDNGWRNNYMYGINTAITGYAIAQRINYDGVGVSYGTENDFTNHYQKLGSPESRDGFYPIIGSRFWDINKMPDTLEQDVIRYQELGASETFERRDNRLRSFYPQLSRRNGTVLSSYTSTAFKARQSFESFDRNTENFYFFSTGDIYPDSYKRKNSIGYVNRDLQKYSLVIKNRKSQSTDTVSHENYLGSLNSNLINDSSFEILPIQSSNVNTSELKRFGLVRLIEATYDWHFNEIDYENLPSSVITPISKYTSSPALGGFVEHITDLIDTSRTDGGEPSVQGFGIEYISTAGGISGEGYPYFLMSIGPRSGATDNVFKDTSTSALYTDFETFDTGISNAFGDYNPEVLGDLVSVSPHDGSTQEAWITVTGIMGASELVSRIYSGGADATRTGGTYTNISVTDGGIGDGDLRVDVVVSSSGVVTSITPHESASSTITGVTIKHRGSGYDDAHPFTIANGDIGGGADVVVNFTAADLTTENRLYLGTSDGSYGNYNNNITGSTTKRREYTGRLKYIPEGYLRLPLSEVDLVTNKGSYKNALSNSSADTEPRLMNLGFLIGATDDDTHSDSKHHDAYLGSEELDATPSVHTVGEKQTGYDLILPIYFHAGGNRANKHTLFLENNTYGINKSIKDYSNIFELSRVFSELAQWDEESVIGSTRFNGSASNPIGVGPSHLYTDMIGIVKDMHFDTHTKVEYKNSRNSYQVSLANYRGATIPNLHISFVESDGERKYVSIKHAFDFTDNTNWTASDPSHTGSDMPSSVGSFGLFDTDRQGFAQDVDNMVGLEMYFKMVLNTTASNVSVLDLDAISQQQNIPTTTTLKSSSGNNTRALIKITTPDISLDANNGKNGTGGTAGFAKNNLWINFVNDLTGYYLVSEPSDRIPNNTTPSKIHKIINHTINTTGGTITHFLEIDNVAYSGNVAQPADYYRLMRIAKDCMFDFTPNEISVLELSNEYTKMPNRNECYSVIASYNSAPINGGTENKSDVTNEAVLSMYAFMDVDGTGETNKKRYVLRRERQALITTDGSNNTFTSGNTERMLLTDGNTDEVENVSFRIFNDKDLITISNTKNMKGIVSFGKIFDITTFNSPETIGANRCSIASAVDVVEEVDEIVNHILENNDVQFETNYDTTSDMYFIGPNYSGASGFHVINNLLGLKNKRFLVNGEKIEGRDLLSDNLYTNIILSENDQSEGVVNLSVDTSSYDFYNEVVVYGDNAKGVARNNQSIRDLNRKITLEITDLTLQTSKAAQDRANKELEIVQILSSQVSFNVAKTRIPYLRAGQVITLDYPSLDIPTGYYQVLEIEDNFGQLPRITVGKYTQSLASRFADLSLKTREIEGVQRGNRFQDGNTIVQEAVIPEIKELALKIIKTGVTSTLLGFGNTLGFNSELGFESSDSLTETVLENIDLTE